VRRRTINNSKAFTLVEVLVCIAIIGILASMILATITKSKVKGNRLVCLSNLSQISKALIMYGHDHEGRLPWQILESDQKIELGSGWHDFTMDPAAIFTLAPMKNELDSPKVLISPLDPERQAANEIICANWKDYDITKQNPIPMEGVSYLIAEGGDLGRPETVLGTTRNLSVCDLSRARWVGANEKPLPKDSMAGLMKGEGNAVFADGSAHQSTDMDLGEYGNFTRQHILSSGGKITGSASTVMLGCCGGFEDVDITEVFDPKDGDNHVFIIDKSGSMYEDDRLTLAKKAVIDSLKLFTPRKKFYVYFFSHSSEGMPGNSLLGLQYNIDSISPWINNKRPGGLTNPLGAINDAFTRIRPDTIWILTDGRFNCPGGGNAVRQLFSDLNQDKQVTVNTVGFNRNPEKVDAVLEDIANENGGTYYFSRSTPANQRP
jgi:prepilin-type N-terminal cleavage/methylation domain-containing protein